MVRRQALPPQDAEDAVQEIFIDVWKSAPRFDPAQASETTFICMIARRRLIDRRRRRQRQPPIDSLSANPQLQISSVDHRHLESNAEAALAGRVIANLKPKEREVLLLSAYQGMSHGPDRRPHRATPGYGEDLRPPWPDAGTGDARPESPFGRESQRLILRVSELLAPAVPRRSFRFSPPSRQSPNPCRPHWAGAMPRPASSDPCRGRSPPRGERHLRRPGGAATV